jgi:hypothetical protein
LLFFALYRRRDVRFGLKFLGAHFFGATDHQATYSGCSAEVALFSAVHLRGCSRPDARGAQGAAKAY